MLPFYSRNFPAVPQWVAPVDPQQLMSTLLQLQAAHFRARAAGAGTVRAA